MSEKVYVNICDKRKCPGPVYAVKKRRYALFYCTEIPLPGTDAA